MVKKINSELVPLTRELALKFSQMAACPGERTLKPSRIKFFETHLRDHTFNSPNWAKTVIEGVDGEKRADGQHTSTVLSTCEDKLFPVDLPVTINSYHLDDVSELPQLFDLFDNPMSARSNTDKMGVYVADFDTLTTLEKSYLAKVAKGIDFYYREAHRENPQISLFTVRDHGQYFHIEENRSFALWLHLWKEAEHGWMIGKPGVVAEMYADWIVAPELAGQFWSQVMTESNPDPEDETRELARVLKDWDHKTPRTHQDKFRGRAKKAWDRFRRIAEPRKAA